MTSTLLIDDDGKAWPEHHPGLPRRIGTRRSGADFVDYVLRNLGFIQLKPASGAARVAFNHHLVAPRAMAGLYEWLCDQPDIRLVVEAVGDSTPTVLLATRRDIFGYLGRVCDQQERRPDFIRTPITAQQCGLAQQIDTAVEIIRAGIEPAQQALHLDSLFDGRGVLSELDPEVGQYRISYSGSRLNRIVPGFTAHCQGLFFGEVHPGPYGVWLTDRLGEVRDTNARSVDFVEAVLQFKSRQPKRYFYESLHIPLTLSSGRRQVIAVTTVV